MLSKLGVSTGQTPHLTKQQYPPSQWCQPWYHPNLVYLFPNSHMIIFSRIELIIIMIRDVLMGSYRLVSNGGRLLGLPGE